MRKAILGIVAVGVLGLGLSTRAEAAAFVTLKSGASSISCDAALAVTATNCGTGFVVLDASDIIFHGTFAGYSIAGLDVSGATTPGTLVSDTKTNLDNVSATLALTVDFGVSGFTVPPGPQLTFSSSQTANWTASTSGDSSAFTGWARADDAQLPGAGVGGATAATPTIVSGGGTTLPFATQSPVVGFTRLVTPFSLVGEEVITEAIGSNGNFTATETVSSVPEPASMILLGTGLLGLAGLRRRFAK